jgi:hypothetical protein
MRDQAEQEFSSPTAEEDLEASLSNSGDTSSRDISIDEDVDRQDSPENIPQELTESYGTGVHELPGYVTGGRTMRQRDRQFNQADAILTGGDIDANYEQANAVGDEAVGGTAPTPDQDVVDELGAAVGLEMADGEYVHTNEILTTRDDRRWELDPKSSDDYEERRE